MTVLPVYCKKVWIKAIVRFESFESFHLLSEVASTSGKSTENLFCTLLSSSHSMAGGKLSIADTMADC